MFKTAHFAYLPTGQEYCLVSTRIKKIKLIQKGQKEKGNCKKRAIQFP